MNIYREALANLDREGWWSGSPDDHESYGLCLMLSLSMPTEYTAQAVHRMIHDLFPFYECEARVRQHYYCCTRFNDTHSEEDIRLVLKHLEDEQG